MTPNLDKLSVPSPIQLWERGRVTGFYARCFSTLSLTLFND
jgi:hypothetical protein